MAIINVKYISIWNHETKDETNAKLDAKTGLVFDIEESNLEVEGEVTDQYLVLPDGRELPIEDDFEEDSEIYVDLDGVEI